MRKVQQWTIAETRARLAQLLGAAEQGRSTIITRRGHPIAALVPLQELGLARRQASLLPLRGSGRGLWGTESIRTVRRLRAEWER